MSSQVIRKFITMWGFKVDQGPLVEMQSNLGALKVGVAAVLGTAAAGAASLFGLAKNFADVGDQAAKQAKRLGMTAEAVQEIDHVAQLGGASMNELEMGIRQLSRTVVEADNGMESAADKIRRLGIATKDANGDIKPTEQLFTEALDSMNEMGNETERVALAQEVFGRSGTRMLALMERGGMSMSEMRQEARDLGIVMSDELAAKGELFNDTLHRIRALARGTALTLGGPLMEEGQKAAQAIFEIGMANREIIQQKLQVAINAIVKAFKIAFDTTRAFLSIVSRVVNALGGLDRVLRVVAIAIATLITFGTIVAFNQFIGLIGSLALAFRKMGAAAMFAQVKALLLPLAIAALIVLIGLAIDDFKAFFNGQDSAIGELVEKYPDLGHAIHAVRLAIIDAQDAGADFLMWLLGPAGEKGTSVFHRWGDAIGDAVYDGVQLAKGWLTGFFDWLSGKWQWVADIIGQIPGMDKLEKVAQLAANLTGFFGGDDPGTANQWQIRSPEEHRALFSGAGNVGADIAGAQARGGGSSLSYRGGDNNITQLPGESGEDLARRIREQEMEEYQRRLRQMNDAFTSPVEY